MRVLHTSDWHLGRTFHGTDLLAEQESVLSYLADVVADERVDVVVVSGDIYDRAVPSAEAVRVATSGLARLRSAGAQLVITSGNHDSAARLGAFADFAAAGGLHLRTNAAQVNDPVLIDDQHGPVAFYGIPYLEPEPSRHALGVTQARGHIGVLTEAMRRIREELGSRTSATRSVVLAHAFVSGGTSSDSERTIAIGGAEQVPASVFAGVDYVALGHLHGPQRLAEHLRYSGSPLPYSFSEAAHRKSVWIVDLDAHGLAGVQRHELVLPRSLATVTGKLETLLTAQEYERLVDSYLSATLTDQVRPTDAMRRLQTRFPYAVHLEWQPPQGVTTGALRYASMARGRTDTQIAELFLQECRGALPTDTESTLLETALAAAGRQDAQGESR